MAPQLSPWVSSSGTLCPKILSSQSKLWLLIDEVYSLCYFHSIFFALQGHRRKWRSHWIVLKHPSLPLIRWLSHSKEEKCEIFCFYDHNITHVYVTYILDWCKLVICIIWVLFMCFWTECLVVCAVTCWRSSQMAWGVCGRSTLIRLPLASWPPVWVLSCVRST